MSYRALIEMALNRRLPVARLCRSDRLNEAIRYAVFPGGKRMRPILTLLGAEAAGGDLETALGPACGVEYLHASSLIFDDLPAMDNARLRRGEPALHLVFGEDIALLAAVALFNQAYALFGSSVQLMAEATSCIGVNGMVGGQAVDLEYRGEPDASQKTTALMRL
ncbi:MAG: polyprenyl synthetase family protein, partial [Acidobacteriota bacterium]|nr:polyprenyl synthetase family protein [Acidobacteriota bacterium]